MTHSGSDLQYVLRCGVFLVDMTEFPEMNGVEIDCIAYRP